MTEIREGPSPLASLRAQRPLTATEGRIAAHLTQHWAELPLMSAAEVAQDLGVNPSSVTRFAQALGYRGYPDLQRAVRLELRARHAPAPLPAESQAAAHWARETAVFTALAAMPEAQLDRVAGRLAAARRVWVTGARGSAPAAAYAAHLWRGVRPDVHLLGGEAGADPERWLDAGPQDLLVAFTVRRYAQGTARLVQALGARGAALVLVTDGPAAPGARQAAEVLVLPAPGLGQVPKEAAEGRFVPLAAPASLSALLAAKLVDRVGTARLEAAERELGEQDVFAY
ncbi:MurR/RpiR family transcriptional regulator [Deinococcus budaensis]|uniref:DNA-binding MurR/RpiR family transcriptional regulator n=1 Tax=Deinococcus budaensis TaxID=1665626 RepID=A0A7W8GGZ6_9DEIO|nr:MurR/RpiR family transcriptional regulator [Deinococcus budaensis]MBB5235482.1 DNA-binding MurR/RpiR family transcriptional regulator [Deinococcus budaensis]